MTFWKKNYFGWLIWLPILANNNYIYQSTDSLCIIPEKVWIWLHTTTNIFKKIITSEKNLLLPKIDTSWTKKLWLLFTYYYYNMYVTKKNINTRLPFCVEASQKTNFERKFNNWNFEATINISRTEIRSFLQKSVILLKRKKMQKLLLSNY